MDPLTIVAAIALGMVVGTIVGLTSVGSGALMTPILLTWFGGTVGALSGVGTATTYGTVSKFFGIIHNYVKKAIDTDYLFMISATGLPLAVVGSVYSAYLITWNLFSPLLAVVLIVIAVLIAAEARLGKIGAGRDPKITAGLRAKGLAVGALVGIIAGFTGVSTGSLLVACLIILLGFTNRTAVNIAIFEGGLILFAATITQLYLGDVDLAFDALLLAGGVPGIITGGHFKDRISQQKLGYIIAAVIILISLKTLYSFVGF